MKQIGLDVSALDANFKEHATRGIGRYVRELTKYFAQHPPETFSIDHFDHTNVVSNRAVQWLPCGRMTAKQQLLYPLCLKQVARQRGIDILHFPAHMDAPSWCPLPYSVTILDLIPLMCEDLYRADRPGWRFALARWFELHGMKNAAQVLAISQNTADDVHRILGIPYEKIVVTPLGVDEKFFHARLCEDEAVLRGRYEIPSERPLLLYVGGIDQRKNAPGMIRVFGKVCARQRARGGALPVLLMAGRIQQDRQFPALCAAIEAADVAADVRMPGFVSDQDLLQLYTLADAFCFLSLYEGFGLPPLEAMAAGVPVVSSNRSAMPEVVGDAGLLVDPEDETAAADALCDVLEHPELAARLREAGQRRARLFPWSRTGAKTCAAYERLLGCESSGSRAPVGTKDLPAAVGME